MTDDASGKVPVTFAKGVLDDVADLTAIAAEDDQGRKDEAEALKRRIAELLVECKGNPFIGELMGTRTPPRACQLPQGSIRYPLPEREAPVSPDLPR